MIQLPTRFNSYGSVRHELIITTALSTTLMRVMLQHLPELQQLSPIAVESLLRAAVDKPLLLCLLVSMPSASAVEAAAVQRLLMVALSPTMHTRAAFATATANPEFDQAHPAVLLCL